MAVSTLLTLATTIGELDVAGAPSIVVPAARCRIGEPSRITVSDAAALPPASASNAAWVALSCGTTSGGLVNATVVEVVLVVEVLVVEVLVLVEVVVLVVVLVVLVVVVAGVVVDVEATTAVALPADGVAEAPAAHDTRLNDASAIEVARSHRILVVDPRTTESVRSVQARIGSRCHHGARHREPDVGQDIDRCRSRVGSDIEEEPDGDAIAE